MNRHIVLLKFTEKGAAKIKDSTSRAQAFSKLAAKAGVTVESLTWTVGRYDGVIILASKNEAKILQLVASLGALGNVRTETLRAYTAPEFDAILKA
ncbi:MAG: GYD domain-containing protein [Verrucomicrobiaceae bacterium]|nr:GYD domain-containing protein [Verrucomicrobiaceae bacterium]